MIKVPEPKASMLVALPSYDGRRHNARAMHECLSIRNLSIRTMEAHGSLLGLAFNQTWAAALNANPDFFLMLHEDIVPVNRDWLQVLFQELTDHNASVLSVVSPIKTADGFTSTAIETDDPWRPRKLTMTEVYEKPETWTEPGLLLNTGLMLVDFRQSWVESAYFTIHDRIVQKDGRWVPEVQPEDWNFSRMAREHGASLYATRKVLIQHIGKASYDNGCAWGTATTDPAYAPQEIEA